MNSDSKGGKHEQSFAKDRQLQNKLLAADDFLQEQQTTQLASAISLGVRSNPKENKFLEVTGWLPDDKVSLRKPENDSKPKSVPTRETLLLARERARNENSDKNFSFYHYPESHRYIEQYRREHTCVDSTNPPSTRNEFLEMQRFYSYRSQTTVQTATPVGYPVTAQNSAKISSNGSGTVSNSRTNSRYKLSPSLYVKSNDLDISRESGDSPLQIGANGTAFSRMGTKVSIPKTVPSKVMVPVPTPASAGTLPSHYNRSQPKNRKAR